MSYRTKINYKSGVYPIPLFTKPAPCGGGCIFCPSEADMPKSYLSNEDTLFATSCAYSPSSQFGRFISRLPDSTLTHSMPCEIIVLGGSFSALEEDYRIAFLSDLYSLMSLRECDFDSPAAQAAWRYRPSIVTVESRPDQIDSAECRLLRRLGVSKVELGVQHTSDSVLAFNNRGHDQSAVIRATNLLKDEGFKVGYHIMLGLPAATLAADYDMLTNTLWRQEYSPDYLKIYPCVLLKNPSFQPALFNLYDSGKWVPPHENDIIALLRSLSTVIPSYVRISRIQRQFDNCIISAGFTSGLRGRSGVNFHDLRSREIGLTFPSTDVSLFGPVSAHVTALGRDITVELRCNGKSLAGIARLRLRDNRVLVLRELRIYGDATPIGLPGPVQGRGLGSRLLGFAEHLGLVLSADTLMVNASFGARSFFRKHGYIETYHDLLRKDLLTARFAGTEMDSSALLRNLGHLDPQMVH